MNENPGGTANPLNPNPGVGPGETPNPLDANPADSQPLEQIVEDVQATSAAANTAPVDPTTRPMEHPIVAEAEPKKKKTGLIIGIIIAAVLLIGGIVAAVILLTADKGDPVAKAVEKLLNSGAPEYITTTGAITLTPKDENSVVTNVEIAINSEASTTSPINSTKATLTATFQDRGEASFEFDELYTTEGNLYLKIDGLTGAIEDFSKQLQRTATGTLNTNLEETNCTDEENCLSLDDTELDTTESISVLESLGAYANIVEQIDGQWLEISVDEIKDLTKQMSSDNDDTSRCLVEFVGNAKTYGNTIAELYKNNSFISSTKEGVTLASKSGQPVYKVVFDKEKLTSFANSLKDSTFMKDLYSCMNYSSASIEGTDIAEITEDIPTLYVEVDKDYNFTRLYFNMPVGESSTPLTDVEDCDCEEATDCDCASNVTENTTVVATEEKPTFDMTTDLSFAYPTNINVAKPTESKSLITTIQNIFMSMFTNLNMDTSVTEITETTE